MKLSEIKGERVMDVIADLIAPISAIAEDKEASDLFVKRTPPEGMDAKKFVMERAKKSVPKLMKSHKRELITILSTIEGTPYNEYLEKMTMPKLITDVLDILTDETFLQLF